MSNVEIFDDPEPAGKLLIRSRAGGNVTGESIYVGHITRADAIRNHPKEFAAYERRKREALPERERLLAELHEVTERQRRLEALAASESAAN